ncbi:ATP11 protein-domain-containing protein [Podospora australis]|uniref:ATP11 protein-domain-containing protein n=1 Tax=Podospora australis TaxID=1536484 RepID=A0AAN7ACZ4_9PEZI|nr:ATP11 protein-domain-containing protein [Podospora australis]
MAAAAIRTQSVLRHVLSCSPRSLRASNQRRWAQVHDVRFLATTQAPRNVIEKYREKLAKKAQEEGLGDINALKEAYKEKIETLRKTADVVIPSSAPAPPPTSSPPPAAEKRIEKRKETESPSGIKPLSSILDLSKVSSLPEKELSAIWRFHHAAKPNSLCAVIPSGTFATIEQTARQFPQFVLPVPHPEQGAEMHFLQWTWDRATKSTTVLFTQLAEYKARGEFAQPHTTVTHYTDLAEEKGVVLMQGQVVEDRGVKVDDARWLVMCLQRFYGGWDGQGGEMGKERQEERRRLLEWFGRGDGRFDVGRLMEEAERMG